MAATPTFFAAEPYQVKGIEPQRTQRITKDTAHDAGVSAAKRRKTAAHGAPAVGGVATTNEPRSSSRLNYTKSKALNHKDAEDHEGKTTAQRCRRFSREVAQECSPRRHIRYGCRFSIGGGVEKRFVPQQRFQPVDDVPGIGFGDGAADSDVAGFLDKLSGKVSGEH